MLDRSKDYMEIFGMERGRGIAYRQDGKKFNAGGYEVDNSGEVVEDIQIEKKSEPKKPTVESTDVSGGPQETELMLIDRVKIQGEGTSGYVTDDEIRKELNERGIKFHRLTGRPKLLRMLKADLGIDD